MKKAFCSLVLLSLWGCSATDSAELVEQVDSTQDAIEDGELANWYFRQRAAVIGTIGTDGRLQPRCTATRIRRTYFLTALHCKPKVGDGIMTFGDDSVVDLGNPRKIVAVGLRPGTSISPLDWTDSSDYFADFAVLKAQDVAHGAVTVMKWQYPGPDIGGIKVGAGSHEGNPNLVGLLMQKDDETFSGNDSGGGFRTSECAMNPGDSGGSFNHGGAILGVTHGCSSLGDVFMRGVYTSVPHFLDWILDVVNYEWQGDSPIEARYRLGQPIQTFIGSKTRCAYACENATSCVAFSRNTNSGSCTLLATVTDTGYSSTHQSGAK